MKFTKNQKIGFILIALGFLAPFIIGVIEWVLSTLKLDVSCKSFEFTFSGAHFTVSGLFFLSGIYTLIPSFKSIFGKKAG